MFQQCTCIWQVMYMYNYSTSVIIIFLYNYINCAVFYFISGSDATVPKKAEQLCTACELPAPNLFIMPYVDRPEGYVTR